MTTSIRTNSFYIHPAVKKKAVENKEIIERRESTPSFFYFLTFLASCFGSFLVGLALDRFVGLFTSYTGFYATISCVVVANLWFVAILVREKINTKKRRASLNNITAILSKNLNEWFMLNHYISVSDENRKKIVEGMLFNGESMQFRTTNSCLRTLTPQSDALIWNLVQGVTNNSSPIPPSNTVQLFWTSETNKVYLQVQENLDKLRTFDLTVEELHEVLRAENALQETLQFVMEVDRLDTVTEEDSELMLNTMTMINDSLSQICVKKVKNVRKNFDVLHSFVAESTKNSRAGINLF